MPSTPGSQEPPHSRWDQFYGQSPAAHFVALTPEEQDRIVDGEPYCFRCGKPASSFSEYGDFTGTEGSIAGDRAAYVREQEGTYNRHTNRFACDSCYIAIGMPSQGGGGWQAP